MLRSLIGLLRAFTFLVMFVPIAAAELSARETLSAELSTEESEGASESTASKPPNILVILFDDVGFMDFSAYGSDTATPNIDAIARRGLMLSRYYTSPFCGPSRAMLMTGMDNHQVGMGTLVETVTDEMEGHPGYSMVWDADQATIASLLSDAGYQTYVSGKWGIGATGANLPNRFGFDRSYVMDSTGGSNYDMTHYLPGYGKVKWYEDGAPVTLPEDFYSSRNLVDKMIEYIEAGEEQRPFYGFLSLQAVHIPVQAPRASIDAYEGVFDAGWDEMRKARLERAIEMGLVPATTRLSPAPDTHRAWSDLAPEAQKTALRIMQTNAGMLSEADTHIGRLFDALEASGELDNTLILITSDNGPEAGKTTFDGPLNVLLKGIERIEGWDMRYENIGQPGSLTAIGPEWASVSAAPFDLYKFYGSEGGLRVPFIMAGPGISPEGLIDTPIHVADITPTLLEAAGVAYDKDRFYGRSALPVLSGAAKVTRAPNEGFGFEVSGSAAIYRGQWKATRLAPLLGDRQWRLYDLSIDPGETTDLSGEYPELFESLLAEYETYSNTVGVVELGPDQSAFKQLFRNLLKKSLQKYWPYAAGCLFALLATIYLLWRLGRVAFRRIRA